MRYSLPQIDEIDDQAMMQYLHNFLQIADFKKLQNGKQLLTIIRDSPDHPKVKSSIRKILGLFLTDSPGAKVCSLQFLKEAMQTNCWCVVEAIQRSLLPKVVQVTQYRPHIRSIQRGSSYFINNFDKNVPDEQVSNLIKLSSTFFRMIHQCVYVWGAIYFPGTSFDRMRIKLMKKFDFPKYPDQFKFFTEKKIENFKLNCKDVIRKMKEYNDEVISKSSIEKKRETSVKPSRVSSSINSKNSRSQSSQQINSVPNKKSTKQKEEEINSKIKSKNQPPTKKSQVQNKRNENPLSKQCENLTNSSLLRKKNSFKDVQAGQIQVQFKSSSRKQQANDLKINSRTKFDKESSKKIRFKTISQQSDSEAARYSVKQSIQQTSKQFSEDDHLYENRVNYSPRSHIELKKQKNQKNLPLKKYISQEIIIEEPIKKFISLNQVRREESNQHSYNRQVDLRKEKQNIKIKRQEIKQTHEVEQKKNVNVHQANYSQEKKQELRIPIKSVSKLPLSREPKIQQQKRRKDLSARKKFVSSEEQNFHKEIQTNKIQPQTNFESNHQKTLEKVQVNNEKNTEREQINKDSGFVKKQTAQQKIQAIVNPKPTRMAKPQKIKGNSSGKTVFEGNQYSIVQTKSPAQQNQKNNLTNTQPLKKKESVYQKPMTKITSKKDLYKMAEEIKDTDIMTIQLKKVDSDLQVNRDQVTDKNRKIIKNQKVTEIRQNRIFSPKQIQISLKNVQIQDKQKKIEKQISKPDPIRLYSAKRRGQNIQFETPIYSYRNQNYQNSAAHLKQNNTARSRLKKNQQISMIIHPKDEALSQVQIKSRKESIDQVKTLLKDQITEQFAQLRNTFFSQHENLKQSVLSYTSELKSQMDKNQKKKENSAVDCGIQAKIKQKHKKRVASTRRYKMFDEIEDEKAKTLNLEAIQNNTLAINKNVFLQQIKMEKTQKINQTRTNSRNKVSLKPVEYEPNTLLYALYRRRSYLNE